MRGCVASRVSPSPCAPVQPRPDDGPTHPPHVGRGRKGATPPFPGNDARPAWRPGFSSRAGPDAADDHSDRGSVFGWVSSGRPHTTISRRCLRARIRDPRVRSASGVR